MKMRVAILIVTFLLASATLMGSAYLYDQIQAAKSVTH